MCKCTPEIRTPFCGRGDCLWPHFDKTLATIDALTTENATLKAEIEGYRQALDDFSARTNDSLMHPEPPSR